MRVLIDTNIIISAALNVNSVPYFAYIKAVTYPNHGLICEQTIDELKRVFAKKFPHKLDVLNQFLFISCISLEIVPVPLKKNPLEDKVRDKNDRPILRAALHANADVLLTGDKDFLESGILYPRILAPHEFLNSPV